VQCALRRPNALPAFGEAYARTWSPYQDQDSASVRPLGIDSMRLSFLELPFDLKMVEAAGIEPASA
jgi:hypothetical protein